MPVVDKSYFTKADLAERYEVCTRTIENWVANGTLPKPKRISYKTIRWPVKQIHAHDAKKR